jgi:hypothetical protein
MGEDLAAIARGLSTDQVKALATLPAPRDANPVYMIAARPYSSTWRKSSPYFHILAGLERLGIVERTISRGETLWRLTKPLGIALRAHIRSNPNV